MKLIGVSATAGYDCIVIPGAADGTMCADFMTAALNGQRFCGNEQGLAKEVEATAAAMSGTICSKFWLNYWMQCKIQHILNI